QLSQIVVHIHDEKESGELFPSVLLSLSGEDGYRNNSISSAGGTFSFVDLFPGSFYLRPLLKEYSFSPAAVAIELESGESKVVKFLATRVAYRFVDFIFASGISSFSQTLYFSCNLVSLMM
ncbi:nodal modulator, partial [Musa troglodytarum]